MVANTLLHTLAAASVLSVMIVTILNGLAYGAVRSSSPASSATCTELAPVSLSAVSCLALIMLHFLTQKEARQNLDWPRWKMGVLFLGVSYLVIAAGSTAGTMATDTAMPSLWIARSIFWGISVFTQGMYCGYLLVLCFQSKPDLTWPRSYTLSQELKALPETPTSVTPPAQALCDPSPEMKRFDTRRGSLRKFPRRSNRYSGGTLCLESSPNKHASLDTTSTTSTHEPSHDQRLPLPSDPDTRPLLRSNGSIRSLPSLRQESSLQLSLDNLVQPGSASPVHLDLPTGSMETLSLSREHNIHPLFRSTSPSPSPTPMPGTRVKASPSAGQTITHKTVTRMRSARSLRDTQRSPSPFISEEVLSEGHPEVGRSLSFIHAGHVRRSITQYEKRYDLNESPEEK